MQVRSTYPSPESPMSVKSMISHAQIPTHGASSSETVVAVCINKRPHMSAAAETKEHACKVSQQPYV
eukprot:5520570-Pleurochrysis_carterae.AAC.3